MNGVRVRLALLAALGAAAGVPMALPSSAFPTRVAGRAVVTEQPTLATAIVAEVNRVRAAHGLGRLSLSLALRAAAAMHSRELARTGLFEHDSPDGSPFWKRILRYYPSDGFRVWRVGETLWWSSPNASAADVVSGWLASPLHRRILLDPSFRQLGVAAVHDTAAPGDFQGREATIVSADFGLRSR